MSETAPIPGTTDIKGLLLSGTATFEEIAAALGVTVRTVYRLDLPFVRVAGKRRAPLDLARARIMSRMQRSDPPPPRAPGRPRTASAASKRTAHE